MKYLSFFSILLVMEVGLARVIPAIDVRQFPYACVGKSSSGNNFNLVVLSENLRQGNYIDLESSTVIAVTKTSSKFWKLVGSLPNIQGNTPVEAHITVKRDSEGKPENVSTNLLIAGEWMLEPNEQKKELGKFTEVSCKKYTQSELYHIYLNSK